jgi:hypothetical protein
MGKAHGDYFDTFRYPWEVTVRNRYSKRLVAVEYYDNEKEAKEAKANWRNSGRPDKPDNIVHVRNCHPETHGFRF